MLNKKHKIHTDKVSYSLLNGTKKNKRIELGSISYGDNPPAQNNKLSTLEKIGFKKISSEDGFVMYELNPATLNKGNK